MLLAKHCKDIKQVKLSLLDILPQKVSVARECAHEFHPESDVSPDAAVLPKSRHQTNVIRGGTSASAAALTIATPFRFTIRV